MATTVDTLLVRIEADMADLRKDLQRIGNETERTANKMQDSFAKVGRAMAALGGVAAATGLVKGFIQTGAEVENLGVRFNTLFGSVEEGSKAFETMAAFASEVPFSLQDIQRGAAPLATVGKDAQQLGQLMKLTGNIAAASGMSFEEASQNVQRALTAGINSADMFRERGVSAMAGFQAGTSYSIDETVKKLNEAFGAGGKYDGITDDLAKTTTGALSMLGDSYFNFSRTVAESGLNKAFVEVVNAVKALLDAVSPLAVAIGNTLGAAFRVLAVIIRTATNYLEQITIAATAFIAVNLASTVGTLSLKFAQLARVALINRNVFKSLNAIIRKNPMILLAIGTAAAIEALGGINVVLEELERRFPRVFGGLSDSAEQFFAGADEDMEALNKLLREPLRITIGDAQGAGGIDKLMTRLRQVIASNTPEVEKLKETWKLLNDNLDKFSGKEREKAVAAMEEISQKLKEQNPLYQQALQGVQSLAQGMANSLADAFVEGKNAMDSLKNVFKQFVKTMIAKALELYVFNHIINAVFGLSGQTALPTRTMFSAGGGSIQPNVPTIVGERGPELIVPSSGGSKVLNNMNANNAMGGGATIVNQTINVQAGVAQTVRAEMLTLLPKFKQDTMDAVVDAKRRGGSFGQAFG